MVVEFLRQMGPAAAPVAAAMALTSFGPLPAAAPLAGTAAVLQAAPMPPVAPQRALLLGLARAGERLVAVGEQGVIALSDDQGQRWRAAAAVPVSATLTAVRFADARTGYAIGHLGVVLRSDDGGEHWTKLLDGIGIAQVALAQAGAGKRADAQRLVDDGPDKPLLDLAVDGPNVTIVGAFNVALHSADGGRAWRFDSARFDNPNGMHLYGLARAASAGSAAYAVGEQGLVLKRDTAGADARFVALKPPYDGSLFGALASGTQQLLVYGLRGNAFVSGDGGASWQKSNLGPAASGASINGALRLRDGRIALFDQGGGIYLSSDGGLNFARVPFAWGAPLTAMVEAGDGSLVATSVAGVVSVPRSALQPAATVASGAPR